MQANILDIGFRSIPRIGFPTDHAKQASRQRSTPASTMAGRIVDRRRSPSGRLASTWAKLIDSPKKNSVYRCSRRSRSAFAITETELKLIAAAAIMGFKRSPVSG